MLTEKQKRSYLKNGGVHCPYCGSDDISEGFYDVENVGQLRKCRNCGKEWKDIFKIADIEEVEWKKEDKKA